MVVSRLARPQYTPRAPLRAKARKPLHPHPTSHNELLRKHNLMPRSSSLSRLPTLSSQAIARCSASDHRQLRPSVDSMERSGVHFPTRHPHRSFTASMRWGMRLVWKELRGYRIGLRKALSRTEGMLTIACISMNRVAWRGAQRFR